MYITANVLLVIILIFGIPKLDNANGVLKHLFTKNKAVDAYAHHKLHTYLKIIAYHATRRNIGIIKLNHVSIVQRHLFITV